MVFISVKDKISCSLTLIVISPAVGWNLILNSTSQKRLLSLSSGSGRVRISKKNLFEKFNFIIPSIKEQQKIANFLTAIDYKVEHVNTQLDKTKAFKKGLLQKMFV